VKASIELTEDDIRSAISGHISGVLGITIASKDVIIEVKSKQNYKSEWEQASIRAHFQARPET